MIVRLFSLLLLFGLVSSTLIAADQPAEKDLFSWESDYATALIASRKEEKPLLLFFSGSDWSGESMKLRREVLDSDPFHQVIRDRFICIELDFPKHSALDPAVARANKKLKERFAINTLPALLLLDPSGRQIARMGYVPETGVQLAHDLIRIVAQDRELNEGLAHIEQRPTKLRRLYQLAQDLSRADAIERVLAAGYSTEEPYFLVEGYRHLVQEGRMESDQAANLRAYLLKQPERQIHYTVALIDFQELASRAIEPQLVTKPLEEYLARHAKDDHENVWQVEMMMAQFYLEANDWQRALHYAELAYQSAPEQKQAIVEHSLNYIRTNLR